MGEKDDKAKSEEYSKAMQEKMGSSLIYRHEDGINYAPKALRRIIVGSCLQRPEDVDTVKGLGTGIIFCLQEDSDLNNFSIDIDGIQRRAAEVGVSHVRHPIRDFDPLSLRRSLPAATKRLAAEMAERPNDYAYIHCTAGLGRAPGVALAYWFWAEGVCLDAAYADLFEIRRCHPQMGMIRSATCDILSGGSEGGLTPARLTIRRPDAKEVLLAGLDIGWHNRVSLTKDESSGEWFIERNLPPGIYHYKFIVDGQWLPNMDLPTVEDNGNINNVCEVSPEAGSPEAERRARLMAKGGMPTAEEARQLREFLGLPPVTGAASAA